MEGSNGVQGGEGKKGKGGDRTIKIEKQVLSNKRIIENSHGSKF